MLVLAAAEAPAARLTKAAQTEFGHYVASVEARLERQHAPGATFVVASQLRSGDLRIEPVNGGTWPAAPGALMHHWRGSAFVPGATAARMLALLSDFDRFPKYYAPEVVSARVLSREDGAVMLAMRLRKQAVTTIVLDTEYRVEARLVGGDRGLSISRSEHIWEVDRPGTAKERRRREGDDDGFLWRLNSYWSFAAVDGGLVIECEAVSMTRDVPAGLGWLIGPVIETLPRNALESTIRATRDALKRD